jgi:hypothetical protein
MVFNRFVMFAAFVGALFPQAASNPKSDVQTHWQTTDQLCGQLELVAPKKKRIIVDGKSELRLYTAYLIQKTRRRPSIQRDRLERNAARQNL